MPYKTFCNSPLFKRIAMGAAVPFTVIILFATIAFAGESPLPPYPGLTLQKSPSQLKPIPGQSVTYTYVVRNTGNVTVSDITVTDDMGAPHNKPYLVVGHIASLGPGQSMTLAKAMVPSHSSILAALGSAGPAHFSVLSLGGDAAHPNSGINCSNATVEGNVGVASYGKFSNAAPCREEGAFYRGVEVSYSGPGKVKGPVNIDEDVMNQARLDAFHAAAFFAGLPVTSSVQSQFPHNGKISGDLTVTGSPGLNVVNLGGLTLNGNLTLAGSEGTQFVLNIDGVFYLRSGNITAGDRVGPFDVVYNITDPNVSVGTMVPTTAIGILLAPYNPINAMDSSNFYGEVIGGYNQVITLLSGTRVVPPAAPSPCVTNTARASGFYADGGMNLPVSATATATVSTDGTNCPDDPPIIVLPM